MNYNGRWYDLDKLKAGEMGELLGTLIKLDRTQVDKLHSLGDQIRELETERTDLAIEHLQTLEDLKVVFKTLTGIEWEDR